MLIIKTKNPFSSFPCHSDYWARWAEMQCTFYIVSEVMKCQAVTKLCSGSCLVLSTILLRLSSWHSLKIMGSHDRTDIYAGPCTQRIKGPPSYQFSVAFSSLHPSPSPFPHSARPICVGLSIVSQTVFPVHPLQVSEKGPWPGGSYISGCLASLRL